MSNKTRITFILLLILGTSLFAQKRVLIVPFSRFDFNTEFELDRIASLNHIDRGEVYTAIKDSLMKEVKSVKNDSVTFLSIDDRDYQLLRRSIRGEYKENPIDHFGMNVASVALEGFQQLADMYKADYLFFVCRYDLKKTILTTTRSFGGSKRIPYSVHYVDFEVYDRAKNLMVVASMFPVKPQYPNQENYRLQGIRLQELKKSYQNLGKHVIQMIGDYQLDNTVMMSDRGKAIVKRKKKKK